MKKRIKKISYILLTLIVLLSPFTTNAASGQYVISSNSSVEVGSTISVTFTIKASKLFYWQAYITYDNSRLELISGSTNFQGESDSISGQSQVTKTLKFKAKKTGSAYVAIAMGDKGNNINANSTELTFSKVTKNITVKEKTVVTYSSNNYLKSLSIEGYNLSPSFNKNTTEYSVELPAETTKIKIKATSEDSNATISGTGEKKVSEGANRLVVKVTAENGNTKEYVINAKVKELDPIEVTIDNQKYTVIRKKDQLPTTSSNLYTETNAKINDEEVPALKNEITNIILVALKDTSGNIALYNYDETNKSFSLYQELTFNKLTIMPIDEVTQIPANYSKTTITVNEKNIVGYKSNDNSYPLFMGLNLETGEKNLYTYDEKENTIQRYNAVEENKETPTTAKDNSDNLLYITIAMGSLLVITYLIILINLIKKSKKPTKIKLNYKKDQN